jgi:hypothetical protein
VGPQLIHDPGRRFVPQLAPAFLGLPLLSTSCTGGSPNPVPLVNS